MVGPAEMSARALIPEASRRYEESRQAELSEPPHTPTGFAEVWAMFNPMQWLSKTGAAGFLFALIIVGIM